MFKGAGATSNLEQIEQIVLSLERQGLNLDQELKKNGEEIIRVQAVEIQQQQALSVTQEAIWVLETKHDKVNLARLANFNETNNAI